MSTNGQPLNGNVYRVVYSLPEPFSAGGVLEVCRIRGYNLNLPELEQYLDSLVAKGTLQHTCGLGPKEYVFLLKPGYCA